VRGGRDVIGAVGRILGVKPGGTTGDMRFTFETIACLGTCFLAPVMMVNNDYYGRLRPDTVKEILQRYS
jgi:NADH-quinone oxidoreductase subunit E